MHFGKGQDSFTYQPASLCALAYRLYTLCERKGWAEDALAYNELGRPGALLNQKLPAQFWWALKPA